MVNDGDNILLEEPCYAGTLAIVSLMYMYMCIVDEIPILKENPTVININF